MIIMNINIIWRKKNKYLFSAFVLFYTNLYVSAIGLSNFPPLFVC